MYNIIEVANTHGGNKDYLISLIKEFSKFEGNFGIKFQPLHPDQIALPDYTWHSVYKELFFEQKNWREIIEEACKTKDIWFDLFDLYSCLSHTSSI